MANGTVVVRTHYSSAAGDNTLTVDLATRVARVRPDARPGAAYVEPWWPRMQLLPGRSDLVMFDPTCARIYHQATDDFSGCAASSPAPSTGIAIRPDGQRFLVGGRLFDGALAQIGAMSEVHYAILLPDGEHIIATVDGTVQKIRLSDGKPVKRLEVGSAGLDRLLLLPDGHTILAFASGAGKVFRIDATALLN